MTRSYIKDGWGFTVGNDFARANGNTTIELAPREYADRGHVIGYIAGDPSSPLAFLRAPRVRVHVLKTAVVTEES